MQAFRNPAADRVHPLGRNFAAAEARGPAMKAVLFDLCGVLLIKQDEAGRAAIERAAGCAGAGAGFWEAYQAERVAYDSGISAAEYWTRVQRRLGCRIADVDAVITADVDSCAQPDPEMIALVTDLLGGPVPFGILSNITVDMVQRVEREQSWLAGFDTVVWSCQHGVTKPGARAFRIAQRQLGVPFDEILFIDDDLRNIEGAAALGMATHHFNGLPGLLLALSEHHLLSGAGR